MDSRHSDNLRLIDALRDSARSEDWERVAQLATTLCQNPAPVNPQEAAEYLDRLRPALVVARVSRAHTKAFLQRLNAAAAFQKPSDPLFPSQDFSKSPDF